MAQPGEQLGAGVVVPDPPDEVHGDAERRDRPRLVGSLAAAGARELGAGDRLAGAGRVGVRTVRSRLSEPTTATAGLGISQYAPGGHGARRGAAPTAGPHERSARPSSLSPR